MISDETPLVVQSTDNASAIGLDFEAALNKLRGSQIKLGLQNEELQLALITLEKIRDHYVDLYDHAPVGYLTLNEDGDITELNLTALKLLGKNRKAIINQNFTDFISNDYKALWDRHFQNAKVTTKRYGCELPFGDHGKTAKYYHLDCLVNKVPGIHDFMRVTLTDVTERKLTEVELRIAAAAFEAYEGIAITDADRNIQRVNKGFTRITGYTKEEAAKLVFFKSKQHQKEPYTGMWDVVAKNGYWEGEILDQHKNGTPLAISLCISSVKDKEGRLTHYVGSFTNVTSRKWAENELRIAAAAFEVQESILVTDPSRVIQRVNEAFTRITGYRPEEAIGNTPAMLRSGLHDDAFYDNILNTIANDGYWQGEIWDKRKNGEIFPVFQTITRVTDEKGETTHYVGAMVDITAQKQAEKILLEARERLENQVVSTQEELEKTKEETAEINTALNVILKLRDKDKDNAQTALSNEVEATVIPLLKKLKGASNNHAQTQRTITMIEDNLKQLMHTYGRAAHLDAAYQKLTPIEKQVASMVKLGNPTKVIAATLNISGGTVNLHRKHIRKKLGLDSKTNLQNYLQSLSD